MDDNRAFPLAPTPFDPHSREVDVAACFEWAQQGWAMFLANPGIWIGCSVLLLVMLMAISIVPVFGQIAAHLLVPLFGAGMIRVCKRIADGEEPEIADLFAGFRHNAGQLVMVGVYFALGIFGIAMLVFILLSTGVLGGVTGKIGGFGISLGGAMLATMLVIGLSIPIIMATWFSPTLVLLHDMKPVDAMKASFAAGAKNMLPIFVFGTFLIVGLFFLMLPVFLIIAVFVALLPNSLVIVPFVAMLPAGLGLMLFLPVFSGAVWASYRDIFTGA